MGELLEDWKPCPGFEDTYEVSDFGRVRRMRGARAQSECGTFLKPWTSSSGTPIVRLYDAPRQRNAQLQRLVAEAFLGPAEGRAVRFRNDQRDDCRLVNLVYGRRRFTSVGGERNGRAKLTAFRVRAIRRALAAGQTKAALARRMGVSRRTVIFIAQGKHWPDA